MKMKIKLKAIMLSALIALSGCSSQDTQSNTSTSSSTPQASQPNAVEEASAPVENVSNKERTLVDDLGITVTLPDKIERVVIADLPPLVHIYYTVKGSSEGLVGASADNSILNTLLPTVYPELLELETGFRSTGTTNIEELLSLEPDVIFYRADNLESAAIIQATGVPCIAFQTFTNDNGNTITPVESWVDFMSFVLEIESDTTVYTQRAFESIGFIQSRIWDMPSITSAYLNVTSSSMSVAGDGLFGGFTSSVINTEDLGVALGSGSQVVSVEELYNLNPEIIFLSVGSQSAAEVMALPELSELDAVKNGRVYAAPAGIFTWYGPSLDVPIALIWHAKLAHPEHFADVDVIEWTKKHYKETYNYTITDNDLEYLFNNSLDELYAN